MLGVASYVPYAGVEETSIFEVLPEQVLDSPEATGCHRALLGVWREALSGTFGRIEAEGGGRRERAQKARKKGGHAC